MVESNFLLLESDLPSVANFLVIECSGSDATSISRLSFKSFAVPVLVSWNAQSASNISLDTFSWNPSAIAR